MTTPNANLSVAEQRRLIIKSKQGWKAFFLMRDEYFDLQDWIGEIQHKNSVLRQQLKNNENVDIEYLKKTFIEMYDKLKEYSECPICFETLTKDNIEVPNCGHILCKGCKENIKKADSKCSCPVCRKPMYCKD